MNKIKIIDLLNMISKGEEVPLIKYRDKILHWNKEKDRFEDKDGMNTLYEMDFSELNDEVKIIEEDKKIEKIKIDFDEFYKRYIVTTTINEKKYNSITDSATDKIFCGKINEIINYINEEEK